VRRVASCVVGADEYYHGGGLEEDRKVLCQVLGRLYLPETVDDDKIKTVKLLVHNVFTVRHSLLPPILPLPLSRPSALPPPPSGVPPQRRPVRDVSARNALSKFDTTISKKYADKLAGFSEEEYRQLEQLDALFKFLDDIVPLDDGEMIEITTRGKKRCGHDRSLFFVGADADGTGRRSESVMTMTTETTSVAEDGSVGSGTSDVRASKGKGKDKAKSSKCAVHVYAVQRGG